MSSISNFDFIVLIDFSGSMASTDTGKVGPRVQRVKESLTGLVSDVARLGNGDYTRPIGGQGRTDETGAVAKALEGFRHRLADTKRLEAEAASQRELTEAERGRSEAERVEASEGALVEEASTGVNADCDTQAASTL